ncbi:MAG: hypothetical protein LBM93_04430 [Oscillospiraceae bacterium]|jgi:hypothetical protein|nr:hypothetical protein [Oscillospiraceae bacterium]
MIFKLGLKEFERSIYTNFLVILLLSTVFAVTISLVSGIVSRYYFYKPYKDILNKDGQYFSVGMALIPYDYEAKGETYQEAFEGLFQGTDDIIYNMTGSFQTIDNNQLQNVLFYDEKNLEYKPKLQSGVWLDKAKMSNNIIPVVITENTKYKVGDIFSMKYECNYSAYVKGKEQTFDVKEQQFKVVGVLADGAYVPNNTEEFDSKNTPEIKGAKNLYVNYNPEFFKDIYMFSSERFFNQSEYSKSKSVNIIGGNIFITYKTNITETEKESNRLSFLDLGISSVYENSKIRSSTIKDINSQIYNLLPIMIMSFLLTLVASVCATSITVKKQLRNFAVYYICGLKWRQCALIGLFNSFITVFASIIFSSVVVILINNFGFLKKITATLHFRYRKNPQQGQNPA